MMRFVHFYDEHALLEKAAAAVKAMYATKRSDLAIRATISVPL
jgi:hypothetical protein